MPTTTWSKEGFTVTLSSAMPLGARQTYTGEKIRVRYTIKDNGCIIFQGDDIFTSPLHPWNSVQTIGALASFFVNSEADTPEDIWCFYTKEQQDWCNSIRAEEFTMYAFEAEQRAIVRQRNKQYRQYKAAYQRA